MKELKENLSHSYQLTFQTGSDDTHELIRLILCKIAFLKVLSEKFRKHNRVVFIPLHDISKILGLIKATYRMALLDC